MQSIRRINRGRNATIQKNQSREKQPKNHRKWEKCNQKNQKGEEVQSIRRINKGRNTINQNNQNGGEETKLLALDSQESKEREESKRFLFFSFSS